MKFKQLLRVAARLAGLFVVLVMAYEAYAVWRAENRTATVLSEALSQPQSINLAQLTPRQKEILLKVEDPGFYDHKGIDLRSPGQGMTTITQGLVKFLYFENFKPGFAKIEQSLIARFVLNRHLPKDQQLTLVLNQAYFGHRDGKAVRGFADASRAYFGKPFEILNEEEYIGLIGMLIGPNKFRPDTYPQAHSERVGRIKRLLAGKCRPAGVFDPWYRNCAGA
ncbi:MAG: biosynthetic peptidoglycan transglycosylase [Hyphomicrobiaceae bacterium]